MDSYMPVLWETPLVAFVYQKQRSILCGAQFLDIDNAVHVWTLSTFAKVPWHIITFTVHCKQSAALPQPWQQ